jgi:hypothetical protein
MLIASGVASKIHDYIEMVVQLQRITPHMQHIAIARDPSQTALRDAFVVAPDGVGEVAYPSVEAFCRALRLKGEAEKTVSDQDLTDKEVAIDSSVGARYVSAGDLVLVFHDTSTTCNGQLQHFHERVSLIRDVRLGISGWVLSHGLST